MHGNIFPVTSETSGTKFPSLIHGGIFPLPTLEQKVQNDENQIGNTEAMNSPGQSPFLANGLVRHLRRPVPNLERNSARRPLRHILNSGG